MQEQNELNNNDSVSPVTSRPCSPARRLGGYIVDCLVCIVWYPFINDENYTAAAAIMLILFGVQIYFMTKSTSIGKNALGMIVVNKTSRKPLGFLKMLLREIIGKWLSGLVLGIGYLWCLFNPDNQCWHDLLVESVVVFKNTVAVDGQSIDQPI